MNARGGGGARKSMVFRPAPEAGETLVDETSEAAKPLGDVRRSRGTSGLRCEGYQSEIGQRALSPQDEQ